MPAYARLTGKTAVTRAFRASAARHRLYACSCTPDRTSVKQPSRTESVKKSPGQTCGSARRRSAKPLRRIFPHKPEAWRRSEPHTPPDRLAHAGLPGTPKHCSALWSGKAVSRSKKLLPTPARQNHFYFFIIAQHSGLCKPDFPLRPPSLTGFSGKPAAGPKICADFCARCTLIYPTGYDIIKSAIR